MREQEGDTAHDRVLAWCHRHPVAYGMRHAQRLNTCYVTRVDTWGQNPSDSLVKGSTWDEVETALLELDPNPEPEPERLTISYGGTKIATVPGPTQ